jgi:hypothetical protein
MSMGADRNSFTLAGTGTAGQAYVLLTASDLPPPAWLPILTNTTDINGLFSFIDLQVSTHAQRFYRISTGHGRSSRNLQTIAARHPCTPPRQFVVPSSAGRVRQSPSNPLLSSSNVYVTPPSEPLTLTGVADRLATAPPPLTATTTA